MEVDRKAFEMIEEIKRYFDVSQNTAWLMAIYTVEKLIESHKQYADKENDYKYWNQVKDALERH